MQMLTWLLAAIATAVQALAGAPAASTARPPSVIVETPARPLPVPTDVPSAPSWPAGCGATNWFVPEGPDTYGQGWANVACGVGQSGYCWAPPALTYPGQGTQVGLDYSREVCA